MSRPSSRDSAREPIPFEEVVKRLLATPPKPHKPPKKAKKAAPQIELPPEDVPFDDVLRQVLRAPAQHRKAASKPKPQRRSARKKR
jgi:hypothetical protein